MALMLSRIPNPEPTEAHPEQSSTPSEPACATRERPAMLRLFAFITALVLMNAGFRVRALPPLVAGFADETAAGMVMSSFGVGALVGSFALA